MRALTAIALALLSTIAAVDAWGPQGHRLVAKVSANHLSANARANVVRLLGTETLADVAVWADEYLAGNNQTSYWHYVNIPGDATAYDRDRDCPRQPGVGPGSRLDVWRDCVIDRITYNEQRLADAKLDRADRAIALKFLVHFVGDLHQPFHALGVERGGNGIPVSVFGSSNCATNPADSFPCNLHMAWDLGLVARRGLTDEQYLAELEKLIRQRGWTVSNPGTPAEWAMQSLKLAREALVPAKTDIGAEYYQKHIAIVDERLALGGLRLAALINRSLEPEPRR
jgi:hypothetical protein